MAAVEGGSWGPRGGGPRIAGVDHETYVFVVGLVAVALAASRSPAHASRTGQPHCGRDDRRSRRHRREVGGDRIAVDFIARGYQDPHFVEAKPSFILKLQRADLLIARRPRARGRLAARR